MRTQAPNIDYSASPHINKSPATQAEAKRALDTQRARHGRGRRRAAAARKALRALDPAEPGAPASAAKRVELDARLALLQAAGRAMLQARMRRCPSPGPAVVRGASFNPEVLLAQKLNESGVPGCAARQMPLDANLALLQAHCCESAAYRARTVSAK